jgi:two-component system, OmpR family, sensor kinase
MGRLFWKFFLAFWLTLLVAGSGIGLILWLHTSNRDAEVLARGPRAQFLINSAASTFQYGGSDALQQLLRDNARTHPDDIVYAVDTNGRDLLARPLPPGLLASARQAAAVPNDASSRNVTDRSGTGLLLFAGRLETPPNKSLLDALLPPGNQPLPDPPPQFRAGLAPSSTAMPPPPGNMSPQPDRPPSLHWLPISVGLVASLLFSALLAWYVVSPIRHLRKAFRAFSEGRLNTRVTASLGHRRDEFGELGAEFDAMASQLEALISTQRRLFHDVSHELRSPLARLQAAVGIGQQSPEKLPQTLERIERETRKLDELVGELLTLARLQSGMSGPFDEEIDVVGLLQDIVADAAFEAEAAGKRVEFSEDGAPEPFYLQGRSELLGRALENIIRNAIKYSYADGLVEVAAIHDGRKLRIVVADHGPGIPDIELERIFEPFYRSMQNASIGGYGLGLAIARHAIEMHRGTIAVTNRPQGGLQVDIHLATS